MMVWFIFTFILIIPSARHTAGLLSVSELKGLVIAPHHS